MNRVSVKSITIAMVIVLVLTLFFAVFSLDLEAFKNNLLSGLGYEVEAVTDDTALAAGASAYSTIKTATGSASNSDSDSSTWYSWISSSCSSETSASYSFTLLSAFSTTTAEQTILKEAISAGRVYYSVNFSSITVSASGDSVNKYMTVTGYGTFSNPTTSNVNTTTTGKIQVTSSSLVISVYMYSYAYDSASGSFTNSSSTSVSVYSYATLSIYFVQPEFTLGNNNTEGGTVSLVTTTTLSSGSSSTATTTITANTSRTLTYFTMYQSMTVTATPKEGYYFAGWTYYKEGDTSSSTQFYLTYSSGNARSIYFGGAATGELNNVELYANFVKIEGTELDVSVFNYSGDTSTGVGMYMDDPSTGVTMTETYVGTLYDGSTKTYTNTLPITAGEYTYSVAYTASGYTLGSYSSAFEILQLDFSSGSSYVPQDIMFGQTIAATLDTATYSSYVSGLSCALSDGFNESTYGNWHWYMADGVTPYTYEAASILVAGSYKIIYRYEPTDPYNYNPYDRTFTVTINEDFSVGQYNSPYLDDDDDENINSYSYYTAVSSTNQPQVVLTAVPSQADNYVVLGWLGSGGSTSFVYDYSGLVNTFDTTNANNGIAVATYTGTNGTIISSEFRAAFLQYYTGIYYADDDVQSNDVNTFAATYTGGNIAIGSSFVVDETADLKASNYSKTVFTYVNNLTGSTSVPTGIGVYTASFTITNEVLGMLVATPVTTYEIVYGTVTLSMNTEESSNANTNTGWASINVYNLYTTSSSGGVSSSAVDYYIYSTDGGITWNKYEGHSLTASTGCPSYFEAEYILNESTSIDYIVAAADTTHGIAADNYIVAMSEVVTIKSEQIMPNISVDIDGVYDDWTNQDVTFTFTITYGGSGANLQYSFTGEDNTWVSMMTDELDYNYQSANSTGETIQLVFTLSEEQVRTFCFRVVSGTNIVDLLGDSTATVYGISIDKQAPTIGSHVITGTANDAGWYDSIITATMTIADSNSYLSNLVGGTNSGIASIIIDNGGTYITSSDSTDYIKSVIANIANSYTYTITVTDNAGNVTTKTITEKVDIVVPTISASGYDADVWSNEEITLDFSLTFGTSGIILYYSIDGGQTFNVFDPTMTTYTYEEGKAMFLYAEDIEGYLTEIVSADQNEDYIFRAYSESGHYTDLDFGYIKIDYAAPVFTDDTATSLYATYDYSITSDDWTKEDIIINLNIIDGSEYSASNGSITNTTILSGIASVFVQIGSNTAIALEAISGQYNYTFTIDKCTSYTITITDNAGNVTVKEYKARVDQNTEAITATIVGAYIGATDTVYEYTSQTDATWLSYTTYGQNAYITFVMDMTVTQSGGQLQWSTDGVNWVALTDYMLEDGKETEDTQYINSFNLEITEEQDNYFYLRMISGSGIIVNFGTVDDQVTPLGYIKLDFSSAVVSDVEYNTVDDSAELSLSDVTTKWNPTDLVMTYDLADATSGIKTHIIYVFDHTYDVASFTEPTADMSYIIPTDNNDGSFSFIMDAYYTYVLYIVDNASNITYSEIGGSVLPSVLPQIDTTTGYEMSVSVQSYNASDVSYEEYGESYTGAWLNGTSDYVLFTFTLDMADYLTFGASGALIQMSIDGGETWVTMLSSFVDASATQSISDNGSLENVYQTVFTASMLAITCQKEVYEFRLINGAGYVYEVDNTFAVNKDDVTPNLTISALDGYGSVYDGSYWVSNSVTIKAQYDAGTSGATLYVATSNQADMTYSELTWLIKDTQATANNANTYSTNISTSSNSIYYYFVVESEGFSYTSEVLCMCVKIDYETPTVSVSTTENGSTYNSEWTSNVVDFKLTSVSPVNSGYSVVYERMLLADYESGSSSWIECGDVTNNAVALFDNINGYVYRFKVTTGSGMVAYSGISATIYMDLVKPTFEMTSSGTQLSIGDNGIVSALTAGWWTTTPSFEFTSIVAGESGYTLEFCILNADGSLGVWTSSGIVGSKYTVYDISGGGGTVNQYLFRIVSISNVCSVYIDADGNVWTEEDGVLTSESDDVLDVAYIMVDTSTYTITVNQNIVFYNADGTTTVISGTYATIDGTGVNAPYKTGERIEITAEVLSGYSIVELSDGVFDVVFSMAEGYSNDKYTLSTTSYGVEIETAGANIVMDIYYKMSVDLEFSNTDQALQSGNVSDVDVSVTYTNFDSIFGQFEYNISYYLKSTGELLEGTPDAIGEYIVRVSIKDNENFVLNVITGETEEGVRYLETFFTIVYFNTTGASGDEYIIANYTDLTYIDIYMDADSSYDYLGDNRRFGSYLQVSDIELASDFAGITVFAGFYDGSGYKVYSDNVYTVSSDFGFIVDIDSEVGTGTMISNLGVEMDVVSNGADDTVNIGFVVANIDVQQVSLVVCYAIGSITLSNGKYYAGGIVGSITAETDLSNESGAVLGAIINATLSDVDIHATDITGAVGGVIGSVEDVILSGTVTKGNITVLGVDMSEAFSGALIGSISGSYILASAFAEDAESENYVLANNMTINNAISGSIGDYGQLAIGNNTGSFDEAGNLIIFVDFVDLMSYANNDSDLSWNVELDVLVQQKVVALGISGSGTDVDPYEISSEADLAALALLPWANFIQTDDIYASSNFNMLSYDSIFRGSYNGAGYSIYNIEFNTTSAYTAMFAILAGSVTNLKLVNIDYVNISSDTTYVGGLVAIALDGSYFENIVVSGTITVDNAGYETFVGGLVGIAYNSTFKSIGVSANVTVDAVNMATVGGIIAQLEGVSSITSETLSYVFSFANVSAEFGKTGYVGNVVGYIKNSDEDTVAASYIYQISNNTTINQLVSAVSVGFSDSYQGSNVISQTYNLLLQTVDNFGNDIVNSMGSYNPFDSGNGSASNPFIITTYEQLLHISDYMYASFKLGADILIGDLDNDGAIDSDYKYDFETLGNGGIFTGELDGGNYSITNLTDSLFYKIAGSVTNMTINVDYRLYTEAVGATSTEKVSSGDDVVFGAIAKYSLSGSTIYNIIIDGTIIVDVTGIVSASVGGVIGINYGGDIRATITSASIKVSAMMVDVGGIVGTIYGDSTVEYTGSTSLDYNLVVRDIYANGASVNAGLIVGAIRNPEADVSVSNLSDSAFVYVNGGEGVNLDTGFQN